MVTQDLELLPLEPPEDPLQGLTSDEASRRLEHFGRNEIPEKRSRWYEILWRQFFGAFPFMIEVRHPLYKVLLTKSAQSKPLPVPGPLGMAIEKTLHKLQFVQSNPESEPCICG
jgi:magnesium-transporting ATPase (P-type)